MAAKGTRQQTVFEELAALPNEASRIKFLSLHRNLLSRATVEQLDQEVSALVRIDLKKAKGLAEAASTIANKLGDKESKAYAMRAQGNALWFMGQNREASEFHAQAIKLLEEVGKPIEAARTLSTSIQPLILLGEYQRAHAAAERARKIFTGAGDNIRLARLEINVGNIFHRQDRFREALECYQRASSQLLPSKDTEAIIAVLHNMAVCLIVLNDHESALGAYEQARGFAEKQNLPLAVSQSEYNIAYLHYLRGNYGRAIEILREARKTCEKAGDAYHKALCHLDLSEIYLELNVNQEAAHLAQDAFTSFQQLGMGYEAAKALCNLAIALSQQGQGFRALELFAQARARFVKEENRVWPSMIDLYQALVYFNEGRLLEARRYCVAALDFFRTSPLPAKAILCRLLLARLSLKMGEVEAARLECQAALPDLAGKDTPILSYQAHFVLGQIEEAAGQPAQAQHHYQIAKEILETLRSGLHGDELKISFMKNRLEIYENLVGLCLEGTPTPAAREAAWSYMEQAKSRSLLELLAPRVNLETPGEAEKTGLALRISELRKQLNWYYHRIEIEELGQAPAPEERLLELQKLAREREREFVRLRGELASAEAHDAGMEAAVPATLQNVREALGASATLLEYFRVGDRILAAVMTEDALEIVPVTLASRIAQTLHMLQFQFSKFRLSSGYVRQFHEPLLEATRDHLHTLYVELVAAVRPLIKRPHLIVVPHELLHYVPFHALFDGNEYLMDSLTVSYAPSASVYLQCRQKRANTTGPSLILGVPDPQAPAIEKECQTVAKILPEPKLFLGPGASEAVLKRHGAKSQLIHIATHGFFRQDNPLFSGIRLGDTFLTLYELYQLKLPADHVTLSGCSTGLNVIAAGDELMGLVRGLLTAGARTLLLTLWDVNDSSTAEFMQAFYSRFLERPNRALALRLAMLELRQRYPHPYYWAPFVLVGNVFA